MAAGLSTPWHRLGRAAAVVGFVIGLPACGGGGGSSTLSSVVAAMSSETDAVLASNVPVDTTAVTALLLTSAASAVNNVSPSVTYSCPGGGTATFSVSTATITSGSNVTAVDRYTFLFTNCSGLQQGLTLSGQAVLSTSTLGLYVGANGSFSFSQAQDLTATFTNLSGSSSQATTVLNGSASLSQSESTSGSTRTQTVVLTCNPLNVTRTTASRQASYTLNTTQFSQTRQYTSTALTSSALLGTVSLASVSSSNNWAVSMAFSSTVNFDANGAPVSGSWRLTGAQRSWALSASSSTVTLQLDQGNDGTIDQSWTLNASTWAALLAA